MNAKICNNSLTDIYEPRVWHEWRRTFKPAETEMVLREEILKKDACQERTILVGEGGRDYWSLEIKKPNKTTFFSKEDARCNMHQDDFKQNQKGKLILINLGNNGFWIGRPYSRECNSNTFWKERKESLFE